MVQWRAVEELCSGKITFMMSPSQITNLYPSSTAFVAANKATLASCAIHLHLVGEWVPTMNTNSLKRL